MELGPVPAATLVPVVSPTSEMQVSVMVPVKYLGLMGVGWRAESWVGDEHEACAKTLL